jgi:hypothetical protein
MSQWALLGLRPLRGRIGSVLASWQEINRVFNHGQKNNTAVRGDSLFRGTFGNTPSLIDPKKTLRWASQNTRGVIPKEKDPKLTAGIENIVKLQVIIAALQETNTEWNQYAKAYRYMTGLNKMGHCSF